MALGLTEVLLIVRTKKLNDFSNLVSYISRVLNLKKDSNINIARELASL